MAKSKRNSVLMREHHMQHHIPPSQRDVLTAQARAVLAARDAERNQRKQTKPTPKPELPKHRPLPSSTMRQYGIAALGREARRRGTTYGKLCSLLSREEQEEIVGAFADEQRLKRRGGGRHE